MVHLPSLRAGGAGSARDAALLVFVAVCGAWVLGGCETPAAPSLPPSALPPPPPTRLSGDYRTSARCGPATVTVLEGPERVELWFGGYLQRISYYVDVAFESPLSEGMLLDFREWYDVTDWRVRTAGGRVRHDFRVWWRPGEQGRYVRSSPPGLWPMTLVACPEEEGGPVLACTEESCAFYASDEEVPEAIPVDTEVIFRTPWGYGELQEVREGEILAIPISYEVLRDTESASVESALFKDGLPYDDPALDVEVWPFRIDLGALRAGERGTVMFHARALDDGIPELESREVFRIPLIVLGLRLSIAPLTVYLRVLDPP